MRSLPLISVAILASACGPDANAFRLEAATVTDSSRRDSAVVARRLAVDSGAFVYQSPSPDGRYFSGVDPTAGVLAIRDLRTGEIRRLSTKAGFPTHWVEHSLFSRDGRTIAFLWADSSALVFTLSTIGADGIGERTLLRAGGAVDYVEPHDWAPDGSAVFALLYGKDRNNAIAAIPTAGGSPRTIKSVQWRTPIALRVSPDGRWIAYDIESTRTGEARDIFVLAADGSRETNLTTDGHRKSVVGWTPDGKNVLFRTTRNDATTLWRLPVRDGRPAGRPEMIRADIFGLGVIGLAGDALYYSVGRSSGAVDVATVDFDAGRIVAPPAAMAFDIATNPRAIWSTKGDHLAFVRGGRSRNAGHAALVIRHVPTGAEREIGLPFVAYTVSLQRWSGDDRSVILRARARGTLASYRVDLTSGTTALLAPLVTAGALPIPSPDGTTEYFVAPAAGDSMTIVARTVATGAERQLLPGYRFLWLELSPDGRQLSFFSMFNARNGRLHVMPAAGGEARTIRSALPDTLFNATAGWTPDSRHLVLTFQVDSGMEVWQVAVQSGLAKRLLTWKHFLNFPQVAPDGRRVAFTGIRGLDRPTELWVMEHLSGTRDRAPMSARP